MWIEDARAWLEAAVADEVDERRHRLPLVDRVGEHAFEPSAEADRVDRLRIRDAVRPCVPLVEEHDLLVLQLAAEADGLRGAPRDARDLIPGLLHGRRAVDAENGLRAVVCREACDHARLRRAGHRADDDRVEEDVELALLLHHLVRPARETVSAERMIRRACRNRIRLAAGFLDRCEGVLPARPERDVEARVDESHVRTHDPRQQDVPDLVVDDVGPIHPLLLHEHALQPELRRDRRDLARVVRLHAADRDERVATLGERVRDEVLELAHLVAAVGQPCIAILALRPDLDAAAQMLAQPLEPVHRRRPEEERSACEVVDAHQAPSRRRSPSTEPARSITTCGIRAPGLSASSMRTIAAQSSGWIIWSLASPVHSAMGVSTKPGHSATALMPSAPSSSFSDRVNEITAAFVAPYVESPGVGIVPAIDARLTIQPRDSRSSGIAFCVTRNNPRTLTPNVRSKCFAGRCSTVPAMPMPAELTSTSSRPKRSRCSATSRSHASSSATSAATATAPSSSAA